MKKILLYTDTPQVGGAELQMFLLAKFLDRSKFKVLLACSKNAKLDSWCQNFLNEGLSVQRLNVIHKHDPRHFTQLKGIIKKEQIDLLHLHIWNPASCRYALAIKSIPKIISEHDPFKLSGLKDVYKKHALKQVSSIVAISNNNAELLKELYPDQSKKITVIHNGIDISWWQSQTFSFSQKERKEMKEDLFYAREDTLIVLNIAELHERKGQEYLILAIPKVVEKFPNIKFVFVGEGPNRYELENLVLKNKIERHVTFTGRQKNIPKILKSADIFCLPSRREAFGMVNLEAMISGLPVIASRTGGIPEVVSSAGILVEPENPNALSKALLLLIQDPTIRAELADVGKERVISQFSAKTMAEKYEKIYEKILG
ncbi:glycosyltransferase family 4 protein [Candidatus Peregrinibacteria bacterium]|nr:glycosyltransferase family 4 protein [Candidatus Peregrinibacteria bacterium]